MLRSSIDYARPFCLENCCYNFLSHLMLCKALGVRDCFLLCMSLPTKFQILKVSLAMEPKFSYIYIYIYSMNEDMFTTTKSRSKWLENPLGNIKKSKQWESTILRHSLIQPTNYQLPNTNWHPHLDWIFLMYTPLNQHS